MVLLWFKALHIFFVISWFAGLFYLPRIFVNLAMVPEDSKAERDRLLLMAGKLFRFMTPLGVFAVALGLWMWYEYGEYLPLSDGYWLPIKTGLVLLLVVYHYYCGRLLDDFVALRNKHSHVWYRFFNEMPVLVLMAVVPIVVLKPF